ncbi:MAG: DUF1573 domain-containing protein [Planctomycetaceae bacterium]|nr:DUF1573 domain-containing protein [Planctomycetaceae bacterium]
MTFPHDRARSGPRRRLPLAARVLFSLGCALLPLGCGGEHADASADGGAAAATDAPAHPAGPALARGAGVPASAPDEAPGKGRQALVGGPDPVASGPVAPRAAASAAPAPPPVSPFALPLAGATAVEDRAAVRVKPERFEYGRVFEGAQVKAAFVVTSAGEVPLVVHGVQASCGCTRPELWVVGADGTRDPYTVGREVAVGARLEVDVAFDTRSRTGRQDKPVFLYANLPGGRVDLELVGEVQPLLIAEPAELHFEPLLQGESRALPFVVRSADGAPVALSVRADALPRGIELDFEALDPGADGRSNRWKGVARIGPGAEVSVLRWPVTLESDRRSAGPSGEVALGGGLLLVAEIRSALQFAPPHLSLGVLAAQSVRAQSVQLVVYDASIDASKLQLWSEVDFGGAPGDEYVRARLVPRANGDTTLDLELTVSGLPAGTPGRLSGRVFVGLEPGQPLTSLGFAGVAHGR